MLDDSQQHDGAEERRWLDGVDTPPIRLTAMGLLHKARADQRRRRQWAAGGGVAAALAAVVTVQAVAAGWSGHGSDGPASAGGLQPGSSASTACTSQQLPFPARLADKGARDGWADVEAMDPTGRYVVAGTHGNADNSPVAILWTDGQPVMIPSVGNHAKPVAVNAHGVVVGAGADGSTEFAWVFLGGKASKLSLPAGYTRNVQPAAIDEAGNIVGIVQTTDLSHQAVVLWPAGKPEQPQIQTPLLDKSVIGAAFDSTGNPIAWSAPDTGQPVLWQSDGTQRVLTVPDGLTGARIEAVRGSWAVGSARANTKAKDAGVPVRWDLRTNTVAKITVGQPPNPPGLETYMVNAAGDVVAPRVPVNRRNQPLELPTPTGTVSSVVAINDAGTTVAGSVWSAAVGQQPAGTDRQPMLWRC